MRRNSKVPAQRVSGVRDGVEGLDCPTAILTSDIEIRDYAPTCRGDDFVAAMRKKLEWINQVQTDLSARRRIGSGRIPILDGGDVFDKRYRSHPSFNVLNFALRHLPTPFVTIPGNHDLPGHAIENYLRSGMSVLEGAARIWVPTPTDPVILGDLTIYGFPYRIPAEPPRVKRGDGYTVALIHAMIWQGDKPFPGAEGTESSALLDLFEDFDLLVCGHNHQSFIEQDGRRILVNPGSLMRADANQIDYRPRIFLWYADRAEIVPIYVPIDPGVVSRDHIEKEEVRSERLDAFITALGKVDDDDVPTVSFKENLDRLLASEDVSNQIKTRVRGYYNADGTERSAR